MIKDANSPDDQHNGRAHNHELVQYRLSMIEQTLVNISESLHQLAQLEQKHLETRESLNRAFEMIAKQEERVRVIEIELPTLKMIRGWVIAGVVSCASLLGITAFKLIIAG